MIDKQPYISKFTKFDKAGAIWYMNLASQSKILFLVLFIPIFIFDFLLIPIRLIDTLITRHKNKGE